MILDGVYNDMQGRRRLPAECEQGREMGFDGKTLIHPSQVDAANDVFAPERATRSRTPAASSPPSRRPRPTVAGVVTVDGRMIENLHVDNARRTLAIADAIDALEA